MPEIKPNTEYINPQTQQKYMLKNTVPGQGAVLVNTQSQEETVIPEDVVKSTDPTKMPVKPVLPAANTNFTGNTLQGITSMHDEIENMVNNSDTSVTNIIQELSEHLKDDIGKSIESIIEDVQLLNEHGSGEEISKVYIEVNNEDTAEAEDDIDKQLALGESTDTKESDKEEGIGGNIADNKDSEDKEDNNKKEARIVLNPYASVHKNTPVNGTSRRWAEIRNGIKTQQQEFKARKQELQQRIAKMVVQSKGIGFSPDTRKADPSGHSVVNNIPLTSPEGEVDKTIGLTEYPKGQKRDDSVGLQTGKGYDISFKSMDENQVANRERFNNEQRQYIRSMTIRQYRSLFDESKEIPNIEIGKGLQSERDAVKPEKNKQYESTDIEKNAIARSVGLFSFADDVSELSPESKPVVEGPIQHKVLKTAPKIDEYVEPAAIPPATGKVKEGITKLHSAAKDLKELQDNFAKLRLPHEEKLQEITKDYQPRIVDQKKLVDSYIDMVYVQLGNTSEKLAHYATTIWARVSRSKTVTPTVTVTQILAELDKTNTLAAEIVRKTKEALEKQQGGEHMERMLYEFPASTETQKRLTPESSLLVMAAGESVIVQFARVLMDLANLELELSLIDLDIL